jgi:hypothetical protein
VAIVWCRNIVDDLRNYDKNLKKQNQGCHLGCLKIKMDILVLAVKNQIHLLLAISNHLHIIREYQPKTIQTLRIKYF